MDNLTRYSSFIKRIISAPEPIRKKLLKSSNLNIIKAICELILNVLQKNIPSGKSVIARLKKHKQVIYKLLEAKGFGKRKDILVDNPKIIVPLLSLLK
jgi:hypothetical protein